MQLENLYTNLCQYALRVYGIPVKRLLTAHMTRVLTTRATPAMTLQKIS